MNHLTSCVMPMLKILYAASNSENSKIQLSRFLTAIKDNPYIIKIAAYKQSSPRDVSIDWTLDSLKNIFKPELISLDNDNFITYYEQVKYFNPDLVISDLEYYTSYIANDLDIALWQCSSSLINYAVTNQDKSNVGFTTQYWYLLRKETRPQRIVNIIDNSNYNFVYSHFGDLNNPPSLKDNYEWIRPYHKIGKEYAPCRHNIVAGLLKSNKKIFYLLKKYPDSVAFSDFSDENYSNLLVKDISNFEEYTCNLSNSNLFVCEGQTSFLADAFYNNKYSVVMVNFKDTECVLNSLFSEKFQLSHTIYDSDEDLTPYIKVPILGNYNSNVKYLHERLEEI